MANKTSIKSTKAAQKAAASEVGAKAAKPRKTAPKSPSKTLAREAAKPVLLSGGNPQIAKGDGDAPVQAYIAAMPGWKRDVGRRLDALIVRTVPGVRKAVKWNSPLYGVEGRRAGLVPQLSIASRSTSRWLSSAARRCVLSRPASPSSKEVRYLDIHEDDELDEAQFAAWVKQASQLPGERM